MPRSHPPLPVPRRVKAWPGFAPPALAVLALLAADVATATATTPFTAGSRCPSAGSTASWTIAWTSSDGGGSFGAAIPIGTGTAVNGLGTVLVDLGWTFAGTNPSRVKATPDAANWEVDKTLVAAEPDKFEVLGGRRGARRG